MGVVRATFGHGGSGWSFGGGCVGLLHAPKNPNSAFGVRQDGGEGEGGRLRRRRWRWRLAAEHEEA